MANKINPGTSHEEDPGSSLNEQEKLHWLLQINEELFSKELAKIVSILTSLFPFKQFQIYHRIPKYLVQSFW